jgi:hypothetical protein
MQKQGNYIFIIEDDYFAVSDLLHVLANEKDSYISITSHSFVKFTDTGLIAFSYVGLITVNDLLFCFFPKYYKRAKSLISVQDMVCILKVLKKVGTSESSIPDYKNFSINQRSYSSEFVIADHLLRDYLEHGLYSREIVYLEVNQSGETNWSATIDQLSPIFSKGRPIYADTLNQVSSSSSAYIITALQKFAVMEVLNKYGELLDYRFTIDQDVADRIEDIAPASYISHLLKKELTQVFTDQKIRLLKLLLASVNKRYLSQSLKAYFFGTGYFHVIWEKVCGYSLENQVDKYIKRIPKPTWNDLNSNQVFTETFRPDIITTNGTPDQLLVLDAKYYNLELRLSGALHISGNPGIGDISKQFLYEIALELLGVASIFNFLLFPKLQVSEFEIVGFVSFEIFDERRLWIVYLDPNTLYDQFLKNRFFDHEIRQSLSKSVAELMTVDISG